MKCVVIILSALMCASLSEAKWCIQNITSYIEVTKVFSRTRMIPSWYGASRSKIETFNEIERIPTTKQKHVCCEGYILDELLKDCIPTCPDGCPKMAKCEEPNTCKCHPGYHFEESICRLDCGNCENGRCTDLGKCECNPMYVRNEDKCTPICRNKCSNGFCAAPDKCECNPGYRENDTTSRCEPICKQICGGNAYCSAPDECACKYGFFGNASDVCQPWCKSECKNGQCLGPNNCACHQGFVKIGGLCMPYCRSCMFGDCVAEGDCRCWTDYVYNNSTGSCEESLDVKNTTRTPGVTASITQAAIKETFTEQTSPVPVCLSDCVNGICAAGICHCRKGFIKADSSCLCESCQVGDCVEETLCQRFLKIKAMPSTETSLSSTSESSTGETSISESSTATESTTESTANCICWGGICVDNICQCPDGLILNDGNDCISPCQAACKNGNCTDTNHCECPAGYVYKNDTECVPQCDKECVNSFCIEPNRCECHEGYIAQVNPSSAHVCVPTCNYADGEEGCLNGTCIAVNKCQCLKGFVQKPGNRFQCEPIPVLAEKLQGPSWYIYLLLGLLILLVMSILGLYALRKIHQDSYNVDKVEKCRGTVRYKNDNHQYCVI